MQVWNVLHSACWKCRMRKNRQKIAVWAPSHNFVRLYLPNEGTYRQSENKLLSINISSRYPPQYSELRPTSGWDRFGSLEHPCKFQRVSRLSSITAATSLTGSQPNFARCLAVSLAGTLRIHFRGSCPVTEFCQVQNSLCILQVLRSRILVAFLHGTWAVVSSQTLRRWAQGATYIRQGDHHVGHWPTF